MVIYVDIVFLENLILDFIILLATSIISNNKIRLFRILLASIIGSIYTISSFILEINNFILKIIISFLIIFICFGFKSKKQFMKNLGVFYLTSITFGGSSFMFLFLVNPNKVSFNSGYFSGIYPIEMAIFRWNIWFFLNNKGSKIIKKEIF